MFSITGSKTPQPGMSGFLKMFKKNFVVSDSHSTISSFSVKFILPLEIDLSDFLKYIFVLLEQSYLRFPCIRYKTVTALYRYEKIFHY